VGFGILAVQCDRHGVDEITLEAILQGRVDDVGLNSDVAAHDLPDSRYERVCVAGEVAAVDIGDGLTGDDVVLVTGLEHGRVRRVAYAGADHAYGGTELLQQLVGRALPSGELANLGQQKLHRRPRRIRPIVLPQRQQGPGEVGHRVVSVLHRSVASCAVSE